MQVHDGKVAIIKSLHQEIVEATSARGMAENNYRSNVVFVHRIGSWRTNIQPIHVEFSPGNVVVNFPIPIRFRYICVGLSTNQVETQKQNTAPRKGKIFLLTGLSHDGTWKIATVRPILLKGDEIILPVLPRLVRVWAIVPIIISWKNQVRKLGVCLVVSGDLVVVRRNALSALGILDVAYVDLEYLLLGVQRVGLILKLFNQCKVLFEQVWNVTLLFLFSSF